MAVAHGGLADTHRIEAMEEARLMVLAFCEDWTTVGRIIEGGRHAWRIIGGRAGVLGVLDEAEAAGHVDVHAGGPFAMYRLTASGRHLLRLLPLYYRR